MLFVSARCQRSSLFKGPPHPSPLPIGERAGVRGYPDFQEGKIRVGRGSKSLKIS